MQIRKREIRPRYASATYAIAQSAPQDARAYRIGSRAMPRRVAFGVLRRQSRTRSPANRVRARVRANLRASADVHINARAVADFDARANANSYANPDANACANPDIDARAHTYAYPNPDSDAYANPNPHADARFDANHNHRSENGRRS